MVRQQLQRDGVDDRFQTGRHMGKLNQIDTRLLAEVINAVGENIQLPAARLNLVEVGLELFEQVIVGRHRHHGHIRIHQRQWAVLELSRRIGFRVNVGNLLELERTFESHGELHTAPEKQSVLFFGKALKDFRSEEHTSELQSRGHLVCRLLLEKKK